MPPECITMTLTAGQVIEWIFDDNSAAGSRLERLVWVGPAGGDAFLVDIRTERALPRPCLRSEIEEAISSRRARILPTEPFAYLLQPESAYSESQRRQRDQRYELIKSIVSGSMPDQLQPDIRGALIREIVANGAKQGRPIHGKSLYSLLSCYYRRGMVPNAMLPDFSARGGKGRSRSTSVRQAKLGRPSKRSLALSAAEGHELRLGVNVTAHDQAMFAEGIRLFHRNDKQSTIRRTYLATMQRFYSAKERQSDGTWKDELVPSELRPTQRQFQYWFDKVADRLAVTIDRVGQRTYNLKQRPLLGDPRKFAFGPGSLFQIDATIGDIYLVSSYDPHRLIGKPVIYIVIDAFSRMVTGLSVSLSGPSWMEAREALLNMAEDKVAYCARYGVAIRPDEWPVAHLPDAMVADRGELLSKNSDVLAGPALKIRISNTGSFRADLKPYVERHFRTLKDLVIRWTPGGYYKPRSRGERDYRYDAMLTLEEFTRLIIEAVRHYNSHQRLTRYRLTRAMRLDGVNPYPIDLWNWGIKHRIGGLKPGNPEILRRHLLPRADGWITSQGLSFQGRHYMPNEGPAYDAAVRRVTQARISGGERVELSYHPASLEEVYLPSPDLPTGPLIPWSLIREPDPVLRQLNWFEWQEIRYEDATSMQEARSEDEQSQSDLMQIEQRIVKNAKQRLAENRNGRSRPSRVKDIADERTAESEELVRSRLARDKGEQLRVADSVGTASNTEPTPSVPPPGTVEFRPRERHMGAPGLLDMLRKRVDEAHTGGQDDETGCP